MIWSLRALQSHPDLEEIVLVTGHEDLAYTRKLVEEFGLWKVTRVVEGGQTRQESVHMGLRILDPRTRLVLIHDAVRPLVESSLLVQMVETALGGTAVVPAVQVTDTIKVVDDAGFVQKTPGRENLRAVQTPQVFPYQVIMEAYEKASREGFLGTDDASLVERLGHKVKVVEGSSQNIKITHPQDMMLAEAILRQKGGSGPDTGLNLRVGTGYDLHLLVPGRKLMLGGVEVRSDLGSYGHSDGDALIHSIIDALLGAAGLGDIGSHFPDTDPRYRDVDSRVLLRKVLGNLRKKGVAIINVDATIVLEQPRLAPYLDRMKNTLAADLKLDPSLVNIKAKTNEGVGPVGKGQAVAASTVVLVRVDRRLE